MSVDIWDRLPIKLGKLSTTYQCFFNILIIDNDLKSYVPTP